MPEIVFPYTGIQLTEQINRIPNSYGLLNAMNLFPAEGSASTLVEIRFEDGILHVLPRVERGGPPTEAARSRGRAIYLEIPHFPHKDLITPDDIQNWQKLEGRRLRPKTVDDEMAKRLFELRNKHAITREYIRMGALKLLIRDGSGATLYDLAAEFGVNRKTVYFDLDEEDTSIAEKCEEVIDHIQTNLMGETMTGVEAIVSAQFFNKLVEHPKVEKFWLNHQQALALTSFDRDTRGNNWGRVFQVHQVTFREYKGLVPLKSGVEPFVAPGAGHAYPAGTMDTFRTYDGPAYHLDYVNEPGMEIYVSPKVLDHGAGVEIMTQSNPLAVVRRPELIVELSDASEPNG